MVIGRVAVISIFAAASALAQVVSGSLDGVVKDPQRALVANAGVTIRRLDTGLSRTIRTNDAGLFRFDQLNIGNYAVTVTAPGFKTFNTTVPVNLGNSSVLNVVLEIGQVAESVEVEAQAAMIESTSSELSRSVESSRMSDLPLLSRNPADFIQLEPGIPAITQDKNGSLTVGGMRPRSTTYNVDGSNNNFEVSSGQRTPVILEAVAETRAVTNVFSSQYGKGSGAVVDMVMKSGSNAFHGALFEYLRNDALDATPFFANATGLEKAPYKLNIYGATLGGPVIKNKTFFFTAFQGTNLRTSTIERLSIPSDQMRAPILDNPLTLANDPVVAGVISGAFGRLPSCVSGTASCVHTSNQGRPVNEYIGNLKVDHQFTGNDLLSGRFLIRNYDGSAHSAIRGIGQSTDNSDWNLAITYRRVFSPTVLNELVYARSYFKRAIMVPDSTLPDIQISGIGTIGSGANLPQAFDNTYNQFIDNFSVNRGNHFLKFGADAMYTDTAGYAMFQGRGIYQFAALPANLGAADALTNFRLGRASAYAQTRGDFKRDFAAWDFSFYAQDDWRLRSNLTLNLGARFEAQLPPNVTAMSNGQTVYEAFDPVSFRYGHWHRQLGNFSPSIGFAWDPAGSGRTSIRGGYRRAYDRIVNDFYNIGSILQAPFVQSFLVQLPQVNAIPAGNATSLAKNAGVPVNLLLDPNLELGYAHSWQISVQRRLVSNASVEVGYLGTAGRNLPLLINSNRVDPLTKKRPNPDYSLIQVVDSLAYSNYHGLLSKFTFRPSRGLSLTASYTYSKALDVIHDAVASFGGEGAGGTVALVPGTQRQLLGIEYGPAVFDRRHAFASSVVYRTPKAARNPVAGMLLDRWTVSSIIMLQSGNPFPVLAGADLNQDGVNNDRPDLVDSSLLGNLVFGNPNRSVSRAAFNASPTPLRIGNFGRNVLRRDPFWNIDFSLGKGFPVAEKRQLDFRAEFFNLFNHPRFGAPVSNLAAPNFGQILSQENSPRYVRLSLQFRF